jgi:type IV pilus assembly protein PilF
MIWPMAIQGALHRPILGWGQENFNYIFNADYNPHMWGQEQWFDRAHDVFLDWFVASGFVGLVSYLALYVLLLVGIWRSDLNMAEKSVLTGLTAGYFVHNIFVFDNLASYVLFFSLLGFVNSFKLGQPIAWLGKEPVGKDAVEYIVAPIAIVLLVGSFYFFNVRAIQANTRLIAALSACNSQPDATLFQKVFDVGAYTANQESREQLLSCAGNVIAAQQIPGPTKQAFFNLAMNGIQAQIAAAPKDARIYTLAGSFLSGIGQTGQALPLLTKAHELSPGKQSIDFILANAYLSTGAQDKALALLKQAYLSDTAYPEAKTDYVTVLIAAGQETEAHQLFGNDPALFDTAQAAQAYMSLKQYDKAIAILSGLVKADPTNLQNAAGLAQAQYTAGQVTNAVATLRNIIEKNHPELKDQVEATVKQLQSAPAPATK